MTFEGSCNRDLFELWLEQCLLPQLQPGDIIVIDNASFHRSQFLDEVVAAAGCQLWYLPAYSPDLNPIEHIRQSDRLGNGRGKAIKARVLFANLPPE